MTSYSTPATRAFVNRPSPSPALVQIRDLIYRIAGIFQADNKLRLLEDRCQKRMQALGISTLREYYDCLTTKAMRQAELASLLNEITIGETCFFRNRPQLEGIRHIVLPRIIAAKALAANARDGARHLRLWSAGCSTGEEPYTLAMILMEEAEAALKGWTFEVVATDINERSLAVAEAGHYGDYSIRNSDLRFRQKYFQADGKGFSVKPEIKSVVTFSRLNLCDEARMAFMKGMDIILCCNVLIYFDAASKRRVIQHFYSSLFHHGYLFLGHAESLFGISDEFQLVHLPSATAYVKPPIVSREKEAK